jgi:polyphenol oxidase
VGSNSVIVNCETSISQWQWDNWQGLPYLTCQLLEHWQHGFFTQQFSPRPPEELTKVLDLEASTYRLKQVHGNVVLKASETGENLASADGLLTETEKQSVWVASADCTPVLIGDVKTGQVAAVHAGWRGTSQKIVPEAIARLLSLGTSIENLRVAMGPAIAGEVYQVSEDVALEVVKTIIDESESQDVLQNLIQLNDAPILPDPESGKVRLDVRKINELQLKQLGLKSEQIAIAPYCTYQQPEHFFSYRRSQQKKVQWSGIVSIDLFN